MTPFDTLIEHAKEAYPHFESPRGQADIAAAIKYVRNLEAELKYLRKNPLRDSREEMPEAIKKAGGA